MNQALTQKKKNNDTYGILEAILHLRIFLKQILKGE
jgi:hypothetical protein